MTILPYRAFLPDSILDITIGANVRDRRSAISKALGEEFVRSDFSATPPPNPQVGDIWFGPYVGGGPAPVSILNSDPDLLARWDVNKIAAANGSAVSSFAPTAGSWTGPLAAPEAAPLLEHAAVNGQKALAFTAASKHYLELDHDDIAGPSTIFIVANLKTVSTGRFVASMTSANYRSIRAFSSGSIAGIITPGAGMTVSDGWQPSYGWRVIAGVFDGASSRLHLNKKTGIAGTVGTGPQSDLRLGRGPAASTEYSDIQIADLAIVNRACSSADTQAIMSELASKYAIALGS